MEAADATGSDRTTILRRFGVYTGMSAFRLLCPEYYTESADTRAFLLGIEERIHEVVRRTLPEAARPRRDITPLGNTGVSITYTSPR